MFSQHMDLQHFPDKAGHGWLHVPGVVTSADQTLAGNQAHHMAVPHSTCAPHSCRSQTLFPSRELCSTRVHAKLPALPQEPGATSDPALLTQAQGSLRGPPPGGGLLY